MLNNTVIGVIAMLILLRRAKRARSGVAAGANLELMKPAVADAIVSAISRWAIKRSDIRAMALVGSWALGNQGQVSDIDLLLLSDCAHEYRHSEEWLTEIDFRGSGYRLSRVRAKLRRCLVAAHTSAAPG